MEEKGEFEPRPEVKPADQVPLPQKKANPTTGILCVVFALIALGLGGYIIYDKTLVKTPGGAKCIMAAEEKEKSGEKSAADLNVTGFSAITSLGSIYVSKTGDVYLNPYMESSKFSFANASGIGTKGTYTFKGEDFGTNFYADDNNETSFEAYKIDVSNIVAIGDAGSGNGNMQRSVLLIDASGNLNILSAMPKWSTTKNAFEYENIKGELQKNVEGYTNVASSYIVDEGSGMDTMLFLRDGSQKVLDHTLLEHLN